jgi:uncharacterized membrane protein
VTDPHLIAIALLLGVVAGFRTFTAPAVYFLYRGGIAGIVLATCAIAEYIADALPKCPPRTQPAGLIFRLLSGGIVGWFVAGVPGAAAGAIGSMIGAFGGLNVRLKAINAIGPVPAALGGDAVSIALAVLAVWWKRSL